MEREFIVITVVFHCDRNKQLENHNAYYHSEYFSIFYETVSHFLEQYVPMGNECNISRF